MSDAKSRKQVFLAYIARTNATADDTPDRVSGYLLCYRNFFGTMLLALLIIAAIIAAIYIAVNPNFKYARHCPDNSTVTPTPTPAANETTTPAPTPATNQTQTPTPTPTRECPAKETPLALRVFSAFIPLAICVIIFVIALFIWTNRKPPSLCGILQLGLTAFAALYTLLFGGYLCIWGWCGPPLCKVLCFIWPSLFMGGTLGPALPESLAVIQREGHEGWFHSVEALECTHCYYTWC